MIEVKILSLFILLQYVFAYLKIPGPSIFWPINIIKTFCIIFPKCQFLYCPTNAHNYYKIVKLLKSFKIIAVVATCFGLHKPSLGSFQPVLRQSYNVDFGYVYHYLKLSVLWLHICSVLLCVWIVHSARSTRLIHIINGLYRIPFVLAGERITSPFQRPISYCCSGTETQFITRIT